MKRTRLDAAALWAYAVRALGGRAQSSGQLKARLRERAEKAGDVDAVMARLKDLGYLNDRQFAESFAVSRLENRKLGPRRVLHDLRARRVAPALAGETVNRIYRDVDEAELIDEYLRRKLRLAERPDLLADEKQFAAAFRRLIHAGFSRAAVVSALKRYASDAEKLAALDEAPEEEF
jgi:regulatory protein